MKEKYEQIKLSVKEIETLEISLSFYISLGNTEAIDWIGVSTFLPKQRARNLLAKFKKIKGE